MKKKENEKKTTAKMGRPSPAWFSLLKDGKEYTNQELSNLSGTQIRSVDIVMKNHNVKFKYVIDNGRSIKVYTWEG